MARRGGMGRWQRGMSTLELAVSLTVILVLGAVLLERSANTLRQAERAGLQQTLGVLRTAMYLEVGRRAHSGDLGAVAAMAGENPVRWLTQPPDGYLGELRNPDPATLKGGSWYFDRARGELAYVPRSLFWPAETLPDGGAFRFRVNVGRAAAGGAAQTGIGGVELRQMDGRAL